VRSSEVRRMPFDGIDALDNHPIAKLGAVERMLATEQQWCKGRLRDAHGRHCLVGAIEAGGGRQVSQEPRGWGARRRSGNLFCKPPERSAGNVIGGSNSLTTTRALRTPTCCRF